MSYPKGTYIIGQTGEVVGHITDQRVDDRCIKWVGVYGEFWFELRYLQAMSKTDDYSFRSTPPVDVITIDEELFDI